MTTTPNFNKTRYLQLLKIEKALQEQDLRLFNENREQYMQLLSYQALLSCQFYYNERAKYASLVEEYLRENAGKAGALLFVWEFNALFNNVIDMTNFLEEEILEEGIQKLDNLSIDPESIEFFALMQEIADDCDFLTFDPEDTYGMNLDQFEDSIKKAFLQMQAYLGS